MTFINLTNIYCPTVGHLIENLLKKSNAPPMPNPPSPLWGLTLIGALETTIFQVCVKIKNVKEKKNTQQATGYNSFTL
jgi:hypothetical protein